MEYSKNIILLCLFNELKKNNILNPKDIVDKYNINNRQMWGYIKNIKEYLDLFTSNKLIYDKTKKLYLLK